MFYGQVRVLKLHVVFKYSLDYKLDVTHAIIPRLMLHATWLINRFQVHTDGQTSINVDGNDHSLEDYVALVNVFTGGNLVNTMPNWNPSGSLDYGLARILSLESTMCLMTKAQYYEFDPSIDYHHHNSTRSLIWTHYKALQKR